MLHIVANELPKEPVWAYVSVISRNYKKISFPLGTPTIVCEERKYYHSDGLLRLGPLNLSVENRNAEAGHYSFADIHFITQGYWESRSIQIFSPGRGNIPFPRWEATASGYLKGNNATVKVTFKQVSCLLYFLF